MRRWSRIVSLTLTGFAALFGHFLIFPVHGQNLASRDDALPIARVTEPYGEGVKDINAIKDGIINESYDSYDGANVGGESSPARRLSLCSRGRIL